MAEITLKQIVEALLVASEEPISLERLNRVLASGNLVTDLETLHDTINELVTEHADSSLELKEVASGWRFQVRSDLRDWVAKLYEERPQKYSHALLEVLALIAYRQPITRAEIEDVRGVAVGSNIVKTLLEHEWIKVVGHKETPGRPALFATTKKFLDHFNLKHLDELPALMEFTDEISQEVMQDCAEITSSDASQEMCEDVGLFDPYAAVLTEDVKIEAEGKNKEENKEESEARCLECEVSFQESSES